MARYYTQRNIGAFVEKVLREKDTDDPRFIEFADLDTLNRIKVLVQYQEGDPCLLLYASVAGTDYNATAVADVDVESCLDALERVLGYYDAWLEHGRSVFRSMFESGDFLDAQRMVDDE